MEKFAIKMNFHLVAFSFLSGQLYGGREVLFASWIELIFASRKQVIEAAKFGIVCEFLYLTVLSYSSLDFEIELDTNLN